MLYAAIALNLALALLPTYDVSNIRSWVSLGGSITSSAPAMANNPWPGGFFTFMFFTPMFLSYVFSGFSIYAPVVVLKLILFCFTVLTAFLLYRIAQKVKPAYATAVLLFTLLNPAILYINYFWAQVDILPVFFFTLGYTLLRYVDFGKSNLKRYIIGFFPIIMSAFIYRYSLILIPLLAFYEIGVLRQKVSALLIAVAEAGGLFAVEFVFFRGELYNYLGALSGSVINMSGVEGFQYWLPIAQLPYLLFLGALGLIVPLVFRAKRYSESSALFFVLLIFIYTSAVPLPDYFLWLYPVGVLLALTSASRLSFNKKLLITSLPTFVGLFFISFLIGNGVQAGPFYFTYPLLHLNIPLVASTPYYTSWVLIFNVFLLGSVLGASFFCLGRWNRLQTASEPNQNSPTFIGRWRSILGLKTKLVVALALILILVAGYSFNAVLSQPITASNQEVFPLYLFPATVNFDSSPLDSTFYLSWAGMVVYNNWSVPVYFNHPLSLQNLNLSVSFNLHTDQYGTFELLKTNNYTAGVTLEPQITLSNLSAVEPVWYSGSDTHATDIPIFDSSATVYAVEPYSSVFYNLDSSSISKYYVLAFKFNNDSLPQSIILHFKNSQSTIECDISSSGSTFLTCYDSATRNVSSASAAYTRLSGGWNLVEFAFTGDGFYSWVNNKTLSMAGNFFGSNTTLTVASSVMADPTDSMGGLVTQLYSSSSQPVSMVEQSFFVNTLGNTVTAPLNSTYVTLSFLSNSDYSEVQDGSSHFTNVPVNAVSFGKLTAGDYGLTVQLNQLELTQKSYGYYFVPVFFATVVPFIVGFLSLPLIVKRKSG